MFLDDFLDCGLALLLIEAALEQTAGHGALGHASTIPLPIARTQIFF
jgi:hypothetical protein